MNISFAHYKSRPLIPIFFGVALGIFISVFTADTTRWIVSYTAALLILFFSMMLKNARHYFLTLFFLGILIITMNYAGTARALHVGGPAGFYHTFYDFPLFMLYILWIPNIFISQTSKFNFSKLDLCILGLIGMSFLSIYNAVNMDYCIYGIFRLVIMYLSFFYMANAITSKRDVKIILFTLLVGLFCESLLGIIQYLRGETFGMALLGESKELVNLEGFKAPISRVMGTLGHPNSFATYLGFFIPLSASVILAPIKIKYKVLCGLVSLLAISTLILTLSRGGWLGFIISIIMLISFVIKGKLFPRKRFLRIVFVGFILLGAIIIAFQGKISLRLLSDDFGGAYSRIPLMKVAMNMIEAHPLLGIGNNNYTEVMRGYDDTNEQISYGFPFEVHNGYLLIASEIGVVGLFFFLLFVVLLYKKGVSLILSCNDKFISFITVGLLAGISSFLVQILFEDVNLVSHLCFIFWVISGVIVALTRLNTKLS